MTLPTQWLRLLVVLTIPQLSSCRLVAALLLPHGDFALDPTLLDAGTPERDAADAIALAARQAGAWLGSSIDPDLIFLSSPHGIQLTNDFSVYLGSRGSGSVEIGLDLHNATHEPYTVHYGPIELAPELSRDLVDYSNSHDLCNVSGILIDASDQADMPLNWGEVLPLLMIPEHRKVFGRAQQATRQHLILTHPSRRYNHSAEIVPELLQLGSTIFTWIEAQPERIAVVISGDLSHTHLADGPYGYSSSSSDFDKAVGRWANSKDVCSPAATAQLLHRARSLQPTALSCGFTGMIMLHGMLCSDKRSNAWEGRVWVNRNATYYGMMVASMVPSSG